MVNFHISSCIDQSEEGDPQGFAPVGCSRSALSGAERFYSAHENLSSSLVCHNNSRTVPQEAQKFRAARPQRAKTRGGTNRTSCGPFALIIDLGERNPPVLPTSEKLLLNVEGLNDARTPHGKRRVSARRGWAGEKSDFFSLLLFRHEDQHPWRAFFDHVGETPGGTAGGDSWKDGPTANLNGPEPIGRVLRREKRKDSWNLPA